MAAVVLGLYLFIFKLLYYRSTAQSQKLYRCIVGLNEAIPLSPDNCGEFWAINVVSCSDDDDLPYLTTSLLSARGVSFQISANSSPII